MLYLTISIFFVVSLFLFFKEFKRFEISNHQAITINYLVSFLISFILIPDKQIISLELINSWILPTIFLGTMFFVMFNVMGVATQKLGLPAVSVAGKMSLIIPVISSYLFLDGNLEFIGWIGILIGIVSIFLTLYTDNFKISKLAIILFIGSGLLDSLLAYIENKLLFGQNFEIFTSVVFFTAFSFGIIYLKINKTKWCKKSIIGGALLGIFNYFSLYFVLITFRDIGSIITFPILNISVVLITSIIGWIYYKEKYRSINFYGVILACISIYLISY